MPHYDMEPEARAALGDLTAVTITRLLASRGDAALGHALRQVRREAVHATDRPDAAFQSAALNLA